MAREWELAEVRRLRLLTLQMEAEIRRLREELEDYRRAENEGMCQ